MACPLKTLLLLELLVSLLVNFFHFKILNNMKNSFNSVQLPAVKSNMFNMSHDKKLSFNMGNLIPVDVVECIPGDKVYAGTDSLLRFAPLIAPVMHKVNVTTHSFFVPNRLVWPGWEDFITGGQDPEDSPAFPYLPNFEVLEKSLGDYLGLPIGVLDKISALPFAAYQFVCNEFYRDQNLIAPFTYELSDGSNNGIAADLRILRKRAWAHDYFTASLPFAQKGPAVSIPLGDFSDVPVELSPDGSPGAWQLATGATWSGSGVTNIQASRTSGVLSAPAVAPDSTTQGVVYDPSGTLVAKTSELDSQVATINNLRVAFQLQKWFELNARGGSRYIENILAHFGVRTKDYRLNRPEYLGGSVQPMVISEVLQTSESSGTPQANMAGHGVSAGGGKSYSYFCEEHGYIITLMSVMPVAAYQQGIPRHFSKFDRLDYAWPIFAHLGEQEVKNREIYWANDGDVNDETFGYVPRYSEYRYLPSTVAGEFRSSLNFWHMGRIFAARPHLNESFISMDEASVDRVFAVTDPSVDRIYAHVFHRMKMVRKLPLYGSPGGI